MRLMKPLWRWEEGEVFVCAKHRRTIGTVPEATFARVDAAALEELDRANVSTLVAPTLRTECAPCRARWNSVQRQREQAARAVSCP